MADAPDPVLARIERLDTTINGRLDGINGRLDTVDREVSEVRADVRDINGRLDAVHTRIDTLIVSLADIRSDFDRHRHDDCAGTTTRTRATGSRVRH